ncbi:MAG TPA: DEAD/DEAH box helicase [Candidatus Cybelea sp.]|nr:DEAD/DEAH box helicase [Candidatus Cybelea sp.]
MNFSDLGLSPEVLSAVAELGYQTPTPIQAQAIPTVLMGRDVLGCAQTGTGKTAAFVLPMIDILNHGRAKARMPRSLILEPTRELAAQVAESFEKYGKNCELSMALLIGGESFTDQERKLDRGVDVLIATPGRLIDLFERGKILMNDVKILVIDEADRMLDMGFIPDVERIVSLLPKLRQTLFFSATMAPEVRRLADAFLMNPKEITVSPPATAATTVIQGLVVVDEMDKREALRRLIRSENVANALIFCNRKKDVDILFRSLAKHGFDAVQLHGDMPQAKRTETLEKFKNNEARLMVCSDVAARGLDIKGLSHVFNFDTPHHAEDYVHRIGRTGRAGKEGRAFTFAMPEDGRAVQAIEKLIGKPIPVIAIDGIATQELSDEAPRRRGRGRGRPGAEAHGGEKKGRDRDRSRGGRNGRRPSGGDAIEAAIPHPSAEMHRKDVLEAATALPEIAVAFEEPAPAIVAPAEHRGEHRAEHRPVTADGGPSHSNGNRGNRHARRAAAHGNADDDHAGAGHGPFGDHTPEFFAREQRRSMQIARLAK